MAFLMTPLFFITTPNLPRQALSVAIMTAFAVAAIPAQAAADSLFDNRAPSTKLDTVVVTATKSSKTLNDAPVAVQVLDKKTLDDNQAHTLKDALKLLPNVYLRQIHGKTGYEVVMQGFSGDQVLVLIDGLPITASTGSTVNIDQYMNMDIEQIEIVQGAASAQFGSAAMGGVINIITKPIDNTRAHITAELATNGKQNPSGKSFDANKRFIEAGIEGALDKSDRLRGRLSASYLDDQGLSLDSDTWSRLKDASKQSQITARLDFTPNGKNAISNTQGALLTNTNYWAEATHYKEEDTSRFSLYVPPLYLKQQRNEAITKNRISVGGRSDINLGSNQAPYQLLVQGLFEDYQSQSDTFSEQERDSARDADITTALAQAQLDLPTITLSDKHTHLIQFGVQGQKDTLTQTKNQVSELSRDEVSRTVGEIYAQDDWLIGNNFEVLTGIRYQNDEDFGDHIAPKVALKYNLMDAQGRDHIFRASIGSGYRVPNLKERYYVFDHSNLGYKVLGNPNLQPETSTSFQVGYQSQLSDKLSVNANGFYNDIKDLIQTDDSNALIENGISIYQYTNVDSAYTYGGDVGIDWQALDNATLQASYAYLKTHNKTADSELTYRPNHKIMLGVDYQINDKLQFIPRLTYESKQLISTEDQSYSPAFWNLDSKLNYQANDNLSIYGAINNVFDVQRDIKDPSDFRPIDNREWLIGASYRW